jgi:hypothetical protein
MKRRKFLKLSLAGAVGGALSSPLRAEELPQAAATGVDIEAVRRFVGRFARLGLISMPVKVANASLVSHP